MAENYLEAAKETAPSGSSAHDLTAIALLNRCEDCVQSMSAGAKDEWIETSVVAE